MAAFRLTPGLAAGAAAARSADVSLESDARERFEADQDAMESYRPSYPFWQHLFVIPDGSIAFGSEKDGRLLVSFPARGNWVRDAVWADPSLARALDDVKLPANL